MAASATSAYVSPSHANAIKDEYSHLPPLQRSIVRFISGQPRSDEGVHVAAIARAIGADGDAQKIRWDIIIKANGSNLTLK